jgi:hypothetical protein
MLVLHQFENSVGKLTNFRIATCGSFARFLHYPAGIGVGIGLNIVRAGREENGLDGIPPPIQRTKQKGWNSKLFGQPTNRGETLVARRDD